MLAKTKPYLQAMPGSHIKTTMGKLTKANAMMSHLNNCEVID